MAGWVGLGMAIVIAISFELVIAIQPLAFLAAPAAGVLIGFYANQRSERWRPRWRVITNSAYAGLVTGVSLALIYSALRLLFVYADSGYRPVPQGGQIECVSGPECTYRRYLDEGRADELEAAGVTDAGSFESLVLRQQGTGALIIIGLTLGGALVSGAVRSLRTPPDQPETPPVHAPVTGGSP